MTTLSDVARLAGVSLATASRALNGSPGRSVRPESRERVLAAARELNYLPHAAAQTMARGHSNTLGLLVNEIADPYFSSIAAGVTSVAADQGCIVTLSSTGMRAKDRAEVVNLMAAQRVRALIVAGSVSPEDPELPALRDALARVAETGAKVATIGAEELGYASVLLPNSRGSTALADALIDLGHQSFAILAGPADRPSARVRAHAFAEQVRARGGRVVARIHGGMDRAAGRAATEELLGSELPDLIFATNDLLALGALRALRAAGLRVPHDIAVAGFGDNEGLADVVPHLTSVFVDTERAGQLAVGLALGDGDDDERIRLDYEIHLRESTLRPRRS